MNECFITLKFVTKDFSSVKVRLSMLSRDLLRHTLTIWDSDPSQQLLSDDGWGKQFYLQN